MVSLQEEELLGEEVRNFPCLYDKKKSAYHDSEVVKNAWDTVAEKLSFVESGEKAKAMFNLLKKRYLKKRNELKVSKKSRISSEMVDKAEKNFKHYAFLSWLDEHVRLRDSKSDIAKLLSDYHAAEEYEENRERDIKAASDDEDVSNSSNYEKKVFNKRYTSEKNIEPPSDHDPEFTILKNIHGSIEQKRSNTIASDNPEDLFCNYLASELKFLPPYERLLAQQELQQVVFKYKLSLLRNTKDFRTSSSHFSGSSHSQSQQDCSTNCSYWQSLPRGHISPLSPSHVNQ